VKEAKKCLERAVMLALVSLLLLPTIALAAGTTLVPVPQIWVVVLGAVVPLLTYVLNHFAPWVTEPVKATILVVAAAVVAVIYTAIETSVLGFNDATLQLVVTAIISALGAHLLLWKPSGFSAKLGGGTNAVRPVVK
jgi:hypothetical protein